MTEKYIESIIIRQDNRPEAVVPLLNDEDVDCIFQLKGTVKLIQILKSVSNSTHNKHDYVFIIDTLGKLKKAERGEGVSTE